MTTTGVRIPSAICDWASLTLGRVASMAHEAEVEPRVAQASPAPRVAIALAGQELVQVVAISVPVNHPFWAPRPAVFSPGQYSTP